MVNEVVNGVLLRSQRDAGVEANDAGACLRPAALKVGVIPAGSTDALVCTTTGEDSPTTSALLIVMGTCTPGSERERSFKAAMGEQTT